MPVAWNKFENDLKQYLGSYTANTEDDLAKYITQLYDSVIHSGAKDNMWGNVVVKTNKGILESALKSAFKVAKADITGTLAKKALLTGFNSGIIGYWTSALMSFAIPPPGSVSVISNTVTFPGIPPKIEFALTDDPANTAKMLSIKLKLHLTTVRGMTVANVPAGTALVPTQFPFVGLN